MHIELMQASLDTCTYNEGCLTFMRLYRKVRGLRQKRNIGLTFSILVAISFEIVSLGTYTAIPSFFYATKARWK
jgi:hypothetical protein